MWSDQRIGSERLLNLLEDDASVVTSEAEGIAHSYVDGALLRLVKGKVELVVYLIVFVAWLMIDGRCDYIFLDRLDDRHSL